MSSATLTSLKEETIARLNANLETYLKDMAFIPEEKLSVSPMGRARPVLEFTAEVIGFNQFVSKALSGQEVAMPSDEERKAFFDSVSSRDLAKSMLVDSVQEIVSSLERLDEAELTEEVTMYWGAGASKLNVANMAAAHMGYHDGQLNYVQSLFGDDVNHWAD